MTIRNLAFEGGGVLGIAYVGALQAFDEKGILTHIQRIAGTSAGSIISLLLAMRYTVSEMEAIMRKLDFSKFEDGFEPLRALTKYGIYKGDFALDLFRGFAKDKLGNPDATFADLQKAGGRDLYVFGTNISAHRTDEFSLHKTPHVPLALAARISMSIPFFFKAIKYNGDLYVDGGMLFNYPLPFFDDQPLEETLGLRFQDPPKPHKKQCFGFDHPVAYIKNMFETLLDAQASFYHLNKQEHKRSILIDDAGISVVDFKLSHVQKQTLIDNGKNAVDQFLGKD